MKGRATFCQLRFVFFGVCAIIECLVSSSKKTSEQNLLAIRIATLAHDRVLVRPPSLLAILIIERQFLSRLDVSPREECNTREICVQVIDPELESANQQIRK